MHNLNWFKARAKKFHYAIKTVHLHSRESAKLVVRFENVAEDMFQAVRRGSIRVERYLAFTPEAERAYVVQAKDVVSVRVRIKHCVKPFDLFANCLLAEIRRGVDQYRVAVVFHQDRRAQSPVMRIVRRAYAAVAPNGGNAHGRSAAQHG